MDTYVTHITPIFSNFYSKTNLDIDLDFLKIYLNQIVLEDRGRELSNYGGYQSHDLEFNKYTRPLLTKINCCINAVAKNVGLKENKLKIKNLWLNINSKKDFNVVHTHTGSVISGVFYIKCPENCGNLVLKNQNDDILRCYLRHSNLIGGIDYGFTQYTSEVWSITPEENTLIMFPSWLEHYVEPNNSEQERISIAFNCGT